MSQRARGEAAPAHSAIRHFTLNFRTVVNTTCLPPDSEPVTVDFRDDTVESALDTAATEKSNQRQLIGARQVAATCKRVGDHDKNRTPLRKGPPG